ncbi:MAG: aldo/keto reductase [Clostridia bacterium]|nr:aldo/keto reductase [Clostridia bacterium]
MSCFDSNTKKLGFGLMRLPKNKDNSIDIQQTCDMTDEFISAGFNYFDTAWIYDGGRSENAARDALVKRYPRESFFLASKLAAWAGDKTKEASLKQFETSLERSDAGYFDYYLMHNLGGDRSALYDEWGIWDFANDMKKKGLIRHLGMSFHDRAEALEPILERHPEIEFVQLQINYKDWEHPDIQSKLCYEVARKYEKDIIVMEPVRGGALANLPEKAAEILSALDPKASAASFAIRYAASLEGVKMVLSGMSNIAQMRDNISYMKDFRPLDEKESAAIESVRAILGAIPNIPCTSCGYCKKGCPADIDIPAVFAAMNAYLADEKDRAAELYSAIESNASACLECGQCESVCPQLIPIIDRLKKANTVF